MGFIKTNRIVFILVLNIVLVVEGQTLPVVLPADSFVESICVNTHWSSPKYVGNYTMLKAKLNELGIRYIRDETYPSNYAPILDIFRSLGIKVNMLFGRGPSGPRAPFNLSNIPEEVNQMKSQVLPAVVTIENPNEYDYEHGPDVDWVARLQNYTRILYTLVKSDEMLKNFPVIGPSLTSKEAFQAVGDLDQYIDHPNLHIYQKYWPGYDGFDQSEGGLSGAGLTAYFDFEVRYQSPSRKPIHATETGHHNYLPQDGLSEEATGKYISRAFAEFFRRGIQRTCQYEFVDEGIPSLEGHFGLLRFNLTEKPVFKAVQHLISILNDKGPDFQPDSFNYAFDGNITNIRHMIFQKRNGDFYIMFWLEVSSWDAQAQIDLYPPPQEVILTVLTKYNGSNATVYALDNNGDLNTLVVPIDNYQVTFNATDKISIIKFSKTTII
jgi:hypothetical protein